MTSLSFPFDTLTEPRNKAQNDKWTLVNNRN